MITDRNNLGAGLADWITILPGQKTVEKGQSLLEKYAPWLLDKKKPDVPTVDPKWLIIGGLSAAALLVFMLAKKK